MSDKKEAFKTDIGHVEVDLKTKAITVDGKPLKDVTTTSSLMELLLKDLAIDRNIMEALRANLTALSSWLPGVGNRQAREQFRTFINDTKGCLEGMIKQRNLMLITIIKAETEWKRQQTAGTSSSTSSDAPSAPPATSAPEPLSLPKTT